jgi:hypothetical protein
VTKNPNNDPVGDTRSPALDPHAKGLRETSEVATRLAAGAAPKSSKSAPIADVANASKKSERSNPVTNETCSQTLWFSFFFDGTGNNLEIDEATLRHSNVAKLFRVHAQNDVTKGIYRVYIPGVGTYFKAVGDPGGTTLGLGTGKFGEERLDWALRQFDELLRAHVERAKNQSNKILEINLSAFGFSRGAALARAFISIFLERRCNRAVGADTCRLKAGGYTVRIRFMGLFDTVASVGTPMSMNNTSVAGAAAGSVSFCIKYRLSDEDLSTVTPVQLAFAKSARPGADPAVGWYDGHNSWGGRMRIPQMVEEVRHFVAAHEIRNSFPLDSVSVLENGTFTQYAHFYETVYPGVHSDVGGSYRPGEGGRCFGPTEKLGVIPLMHMFEHAIAKGVPLIPRTAWKASQKRDFEVHLEVQSSYNHYIKKLDAKSSLGALFNAHMALYFAWRFRAIRVKAEGDLSEANRIEQGQTAFQTDRTLQEANVVELTKKNDAALKNCAEIRTKRSNLMSRGFVDPKQSDAMKQLDNALRDGETLQGEAQDRLLQAKARLDAIPNMNGFKSMLAMYDQQLLSDVREIRKVIAGADNSKSRGNKKAELRPHYRALVEAYENEFVHKKGLTDKLIIGFFDNYVHDSLSGFAKDATLPSDPRVIYVGGDEKLKFASLNEEPNSPIDGSRNT